MSRRRRRRVRTAHAVAQTGAPKSFTQSARTPATPRVPNLQRRSGGGSDKRCSGRRDWPRYHSSSLSSAEAAQRGSPSKWQSSAVHSTGVYKDACHRASLPLQPTSPSARSHKSISTVLCRPAPPSMCNWMAASYRAARVAANDSLDKLERVAAANWPFRSLPATTLQLFILKTNGRR